MQNYRVCFDYEGENPVKAIIHLLGFVKDENLQEIPINWLVIDLASGKEYKIVRSLAQLESEAKADVEEFLSGEDLD